MLIDCPLPSKEDGPLAKLSETKKEFDFWKGSPVSFVLNYFPLIYSYFPFAVWMAAIEAGN
jgi:hypothetical protein